MTEDLLQAGQSLGGRPGGAEAGQSRFDLQARLHHLKRSRTAGQRRYQRRAHRGALSSERALALVPPDESLGLEHVEGAAYGPASDAEFRSKVPLRGQPRLALINPGIE